jgi:hypothetical protein
MMPKQHTEPRFVNMQSMPVHVYDANRRTVTVHPWNDKPHKEGALYVVEGLHYRQFLGARGPLSPFPETRADREAKKVVQKTPPTPDKSDKPVDVGEKDVQEQAKAPEEEKAKAPKEEKEKVKEPETKEDAAEVKEDDDKGKKKPKKSKKKGGKKKAKKSGDK